MNKKTIKEILKTVILLFSIIITLIIIYSIGRLHGVTTASSYFVKYEDVCLSINKTSFINDSCYVSINNGVNCYKYNNLKIFSNYSYSDTELWFQNLRNRLVIGGSIEKC